MSHHKTLACHPDLCHVANANPQQAEVLLGHLVEHSLAQPCNMASVGLHHDEVTQGHSSGCFSHSSMPKSNSQAINPPGILGKGTPDHVLMFDNEPSFQFIENTVSNDIDDQHITDSNFFGQYCEQGAILVALAYCGDKSAQEIIQKELHARGVKEKDASPLLQYLLWKWHDPAQLSIHAHLE